MIYIVLFWIFGMLLLSLWNFSLGDLRNSEVTWSQGGKTMSDGRWFGMRLVLCFNDRTVIDGRSNDSDRDVVRFFPQLWSREIGFWTSFYNWVPCIWNPTSPILPKTKMHQTYHNASGKWQILLNAFLSPCPIVRHLRPLPCEVRARLNFRCRIKASIQKVTNDLLAGWWYQNTTLRSCHCFFSFFL